MSNTNTSLKCLFCFLFFYNGIELGIKNCGISWKKILVSTTKLSTTYFLLLSAIVTPTLDNTQTSLIPIFLKNTFYRSYYPELGTLFSVHLH